MNYTEYKITLDIHKTVSPVSLRVKKGDTRRRLLIHLTERCRPYHISEGCFAVFTAQKPDGNVVYNECSIEDCVIVYDMTEQTTAVPGVLECEIKLYGADNGLLTSSGFHILVDDTVYDADTEVESASEYSALTALVAKILANEQAVAVQQEKNTEQDQAISALLLRVNALQGALEAQEAKLTEQEAKIKELEEKLGDGGCDCGGDSGGGDDPGDDDPGTEVQKLTAPVIRLETVTDSGADDGGTEDDGTEDDGAYTPAILGVAVLGRTILGKTDSLPKLTAPVISLVESAGQLAAPVIELVTVTDSDAEDDNAGSGGTEETADVTWNAYGLQGSGAVYEVSNRIHTELLPLNIGTVSAADGYAYAILGINTISGAAVGFLDAEGNVSGDPTWLTTETDLQTLLTVEGVYGFKAVARRTDDADIDTSAGENIVFTKSETVVWEEGGTGSSGYDEAVSNRIRTVGCLPDAAASVKAASADYLFVLTCYKADGSGLGWWHTDTEAMGSSDGLIWTSTTAISLTDIKTAVPECAYFRVTVKKKDGSAISVTEGSNILLYDAEGNALDITKTPQLAAPVITLEEVTLVLTAPIIELVEE